MMTRPSSSLSRGCLVTLGMGAACGFFGLNGDTDLTNLQCVEGTPEGSSLVVGSSVGATLGEVDHARSDCGGEGNADETFRLSVSVSGTYRVYASAEFDVVLYVLEDPCDGPGVIDCVDGSGTGSSESLTVDLVAEEDYVVVVDSYSSEASGWMDVGVELVAGDVDDGGATSQATSGGPPGETPCASSPEELPLQNDGERWYAIVGGTTYDSRDLVPGCGLGGDALDVWYLPTSSAPGIYRITVDGSVSSVSVWEADSCTHTACAAPAPFGGTRAGTELEIFGGDRLVVVEGYAGTSYSLDVRQVLDQELEGPCARSCPGGFECPADEVCLSTSAGQVCLPPLCESCFADGQTCSTYPLSCDGLECS